MGPLRFERRTARFLIGTDDNYEPSALTWLSYGPADAANRARTCDIMVNSHALYQLSYSGLHNNHGSTDLNLVLHRKFITYRADNRKGSTLRIC